MACPEFSMGSDKNQEPIRSLVKLLGVTPAHGASPISKPKVPSPLDNKIETRAEIAGDSRPEVNGVITIDSAQIIPIWKGNVACPLGVGWRLNNQASSRYPDRMFMQGESAWHIGGWEQEGVLCKDGSYFLFSGVARDRSYFLRVQQRTSAEFAAVWSALIEIKGDVIPTRDGSLWLRRIEVVESDLLFTGYDEDAKRSITFRVSKR
jgi:hypothetical protein